MIIIELFNVRIMYGPSQPQRNANRLASRKATVDPPQRAQSNAVVERARFITGGRRFRRIERIGGRNNESGKG